jgi:alpha-1,2-mannosyltransferase
VSRALSADALRGTPRIWRVAALCGLVFLAAVVAGRVAARLFYNDVVWSFNGWFVPYDLAIFLRAGDAVLAGESPYPSVAELTGDTNYVYPPPLALLMTPLAAGPSGLAATIFTTLSIASIIAALLCLEVRDWRCHAVALLSPFAHEALRWGTVGPFLLLLVALCWRYRDSLVGAAGAAGGAIVLKLFAWPLVVWLAATRRLRHAGLAVVFAGAVALVSWAAIAFRGLIDYPRLLEKLSDLEAERSYSVYALGIRLGLADTAAYAAAIALGVALLVLAVRAARRPDDPRERDRRSLTLVVAASLVLSPIVWFHYLLLLLVPIALARPRLGALWLAPLALWLLFHWEWFDDWPEGNLAELLTVGALVTLVIAACLRPIVSPARTSWWRAGHEGI